MKQLTIFFLFITLYSCDNITIEEFIPDDITPPMIYSLTATSANTLTIISNENITLSLESYSNNQDIEINDYITNENSIDIILDKSMIPGEKYTSEFKIIDKSGNSLWFIADYYGYNNNLPEVMINEFTAKGSKSNPSKIELYVIKGGNMAGITLFNGTYNSFDYSYTFPDFNVNEGEYIVIRTISDNYPIPFIEIDDFSIDHDKKFIDGVRDCRIDNFKLSTTNGIISLYSNPFGSIIDCVIYSKNHNDLEKNNRNFGLKKTVERVDEIAETDEWISDSGIIYPDDVIYIGGSTSTRSLNRYRYEDNNSKNEWYTVDTRESTFGYKNSEEIYN